jgi:spoIIIJ-associated protein
MDNRKNLDDYLAGLGISEADEAAPPTPQAEAGPGLAAPAAPGTDAGAAATEVTGAAAAEVIGDFLRGLVARIGPQGSGASSGGPALAATPADGGPGGEPSAALGVNVTQTDDAIEAEITGDGAGKLAGRDGRVLGAIEVMCYAVLARHLGRSELRVRVDAGGYRRRHAENLTRVAERLALSVAKSGETHEMQPMPPADRRVIHIALKNHDLVTTESVGEGQSRRLIIHPRTEPVGAAGDPPAPAAENAAGSPSARPAVRPEED